MISPGILTPSEQRIFDLLQDGMAHPVTDFFPLLWDEEGISKPTTVRHMMCDIRKKIGVCGLDITGRGVNGTTVYRLVRFVRHG